jgi:hypothetical protein
MTRTHHPRDAHAVARPTGGRVGPFVTGAASTKEAQLFVGCDHFSDET